MPLDGLTNYGIARIVVSKRTGGTALAEVLFGAVNPSGRLAVTFEKKQETTPRSPTITRTQHKRVCLQGRPFRRLPRV